MQQMTTRLVFRFALAVFTYLMLTGCKHPVTQQCGVCRPRDATKTAADDIRSAGVWIGSRLYGFAGESTNQLAQSLDTIIESHCAYRILVELLETARPAGQLYALCGLYHVRPDVFGDAAERFRNNTNVVEAIVGDVVLPMRMCDVVFSPYGRGVGETNIVLRPGQTVGAWMKEQRNGVRPFMDISGGSIPMTLRFGLGP